MNIPDEVVDAAARAIWTATGHRESDWIYMAPETERPQRYTRYARAALEAALDRMDRGGL
jgi:hypothetical protein